MENDKKFFMGSKQNRKKLMKALVCTYPFATNIVILMFCFADDADGLHYQPANALATLVQYKMGWPLKLYKK